MSAARKALPAYRRVLLNQAQASRGVLEAALTKVLSRHLDELGDVCDVSAGLSQRLKLPVHPPSVAVGVAARQGACPDQPPSGSVAALPRCATSHTAHLGPLRDYLQ